MCGRAFTRRDSAVWDGVKIGRVAGDFFSRRNVAPSFLGGRLVSVSSGRVEKKASLLLSLRELKAETNGF